MRGWLRRRTLPKAEAQRLLDGGSGDSAVADLLRAASGPARPGELAGEQAAIAAFRQEYAAGRRTSDAAGDGAADRGRPPRGVRRTGRRVAVLAAALTAAALAGTGVAAGAGHLPAPLQRAAHDWIDQVPEPDPQPAPQRTGRAESPTPPATQRPSSTVSPSHPGTSSTAAAGDFKKLCKEWEKVRDDPHRKPMDPADLRALTAAAGGPEHIERFCGLTPSGSAAVPSGPTGPPGASRSKKASRRANA
ncbi:hypothetical protein [Dactylosporangium siamense]|uniref:Uncharacterized protein n=1 Tax=Dactylosporangium siamense TaxID=685454 RepID=A0A919PH01_9ACTN|nr:hypothetical protein [Dactylosporangium siamense]GIG44685.1 hypothetical protein Dsi01nite_027260 [Dactylosporangium siamense]